MKSTVTFDRDSFIIDGKREKIAAGAIHYFRIPRELWKDRIEKAKLSGLNAIETYFAWNAHEFREGHFDLNSNLDIDAFFKTCEDCGMRIIARPGPYICAEWDNGGLPAWLNIKPGIRLRTYNKAYLDCVARFFDKCIPIIEKHQHGDGGVIMVQIENEYLYPKRIGAGKYLTHLRDDMRSRGIHVPLFACNFMAKPVKGVIETYNSGSGFKKPLKVYRRQFPRNPLLVTEFWDGWFDAWGRRHQVKDAKAMADQLREIKDLGGMYVQYMFTGGTNFGFWGGRTVGNDHVFMITSYDYDAPLSETGRITEKLVEFSKVNYALRGLKPVPLKVDSKPDKLPKLPVISGWRSEDVGISGWRKLSCFESFEKLGRYFGYGVYRTRLRSDTERLASIFFSKYGDRIKVFSNGRLCGTYGRGEGASKTPIQTPLRKGANELLFLVDNMGRFNYSLSVGELKGIFGPAYLDGRALDMVWLVTDTKGWKVKRDRVWDTEVYAAGKPLQSIFGKQVGDEHVVARATFNGEKGMKYFTAFSSWRRGNELSVFVNGHQIYYVTAWHTTGTIADFDISERVVDGRNTVEIFTRKNKEGDYEYLKECRVFECSEELNGEFSYADFEPLAIGSSAAPAPLRRWKARFNLSWPKYPVRLRMDGMGKGQIYLNGRNIGRYWQIGPQRDYYLPEPWLEGDNELVIFEEEGKEPKNVRLVYDSDEALALLDNT